MSIFYAPQLYRQVLL